MLNLKKGNNTHHDDQHMLKYVLLFLIKKSRFSVIPVQSIAAALKYPRCAKQKVQTVLNGWGEKKQIKIFPFKLNNTLWFGDK